MDFIEVSIMDTDEDSTVDFEQVIVLVKGLAGHQAMYIETVPVV
jgi:hypothetical protein